MIPTAIDFDSIISDLNRWGWRDYKIDMACGFCVSYTAQIKRRDIRAMSYQKAAALYNLWELERDLQTLQSQTLAATT